MADLLSILNDTIEVDITYRVLEIKAQVYTEKLTPEYKAQLVVLASVKSEGAEDQETQDKDENALLLSELIESWDLTNDKQPYPPTYENLARLSFPMLSCIARAISLKLGALANPQSATN